MKKLTAKQIKDYIDSEGVVCPYCGSLDIEGTGETTIDYNMAINITSCINCGRIWKDVYLLKTIQEIEP